MGPGSPRGLQRMPTLGGLDMESIPAHLVGFDDVDDDEHDVMNWRDRSVLQYPPSVNGSSRGNTQRMISDAV